MFKFEGTILPKMLQVYDRTEEAFYQDITKIKNWMRTQPHLPETLDDRAIQNFLLLNKCSVEKAKQKIDNYYTMRSLIPEFYDQMNPLLPHNQQTMEFGYWISLPKLTEAMYRVSVFKIRNDKYIDVVDHRCMMVYALNNQELRLHEDHMLGDVLIFDVKGLTLGYIMKMTPVLIAKSIAAYERVYSIPVKKVYVINSHSLMEKLLALIKKLIKPKIAQRIHVFQESTILLEDFPKNIIPKDFGGDEKSLEELQEIQKKKFAEYSNRFELLDKIRVNESLRPEKLVNDDFMGFHGSFKTLSVD